MYKYTLTSLTITDLSDAFGWLITVSVSIYLNEHKQKHTICFLNTCSWDRVSFLCGISSKVTKSKIVGSSIALIWNRGEMLCSGCKKRIFYLCFMKTCMYSFRYIEMFLFCIWFKFQNLFNSNLTLFHDDFMWWGFCDYDI